MDLWKSLQQEWRTDLWVHFLQRQITNNIIKLYTTHICMYVHVHSQFSKKWFWRRMWLQGLSHISHFLCQNAVCLSFQNIKICDPQCDFRDKGDDTLTTHLVCPKTEFMHIFNYWNNQWHTRFCFGLFSTLILCFSQVWSMTRLVCKVDTD